MASKPSAHNQRLRRQSECGTKVRFKKAYLAKEACTRIKDRSGEAMHPYRCRFCQYWHIGH